MSTIETPLEKEMFLVNERIACLVRRMRRLELDYDKLAENLKRMMEVIYQLSDDIRQLRAELYRHERIT